MEQTQADTAQLIPRYLAGQLSAEEAAAFEEAYSRDPRLVAEIERVLRLKEGLAVLRERGELNVLLRRSPRPRWWVGLAAAAAVVAVVVGVNWYQRHGAGEPQLSSVPMLSLVVSPASPVVRSYTLVRIRGAAPPIDIPESPQPGAIELRILPSGVPSPQGYAVRLTKLEGSARHPIGRADSVAAAADRYVRVYIDRHRLSRGDYEISVAAESAGLESSPADRFALRVR
jgi:hypothetical protein